MQIDNKTKAAVLREYAEKMKQDGQLETAGNLIYEAEELDPPEKPIHPHDGCEGMVIEALYAIDVYIAAGDMEVAGDFEIKHNHGWQIPRQASKVPAFLCDGARPGWLNDDDRVWMISELKGKVHIYKADDWNWENHSGAHFCVLNPVEVE